MEGVGTLCKFGPIVTVGLEQVHKKILTNQSCFLRELTLAFLGHSVELLDVHSDAVLLRMHVQICNFSPIDGELCVKFVLYLGTPLQPRIIHLFCLPQGEHTSGVGVNLNVAALQRQHRYTNLPQHILDSCYVFLLLVFILLQKTILRAALILVIFYFTDILTLYPVRCAT